MSIPSCPKCHRKTYSPKFGTCTACEYKKVTEPVTNDETRHVTETKPVTVEEAVEVAKEKVTSYVTQSNETHNVTGEGGRHCKTCTCGPPKTGAERQRKWRKKGKLSE